ncbi:hypothetical protein LF887_17235 [Chryseobacterium sp. MEBOG06]|uniref:hypothetical protein n=1 Tax=Chryseobacterium sp. MEBOG06 TaxID=2879938 RepID=UPI001F2B454B|nr:hypothetical protein [Chryseobacterium sp. MEBOG06]UKB82745.1 hypothetical protein LF887_17235 [Chryseobacterium sp. MEBOG06]
MNNIEKLLEAIKEQAEKFLLENGEFAPYATHIKADGKLTYISAYSESTDSKEIYDILLAGAYEDLQDEEVRVYAIAMDGRYQGKDVLVIEFILSPEKIYQQTYPYTIENKKVIFGQLI